MTTTTLEERVHQRKHPIGFASARNAQHAPTRTAQDGPQTDGPHPLETVATLFEWATLVGCAAADGQQRAKAAWAEITKARQQ